MSEDKFFDAAINDVIFQYFKSAQHRPRSMQQCFNRFFGIAEATASWWNRSAG